KIDRAFVRDLSSRPRMPDGDRGDHGHARDLRIDKIKIDRAFVRDLSSRPRMPDGDRGDHGHARDLRID
ncbi:hypothetical protein CTI14_72305, partial [Methylobacterium radiotolerans]